MGTLVESADAEHEGKRREEESRRGDGALVEVGLNIGEDHADHIEDGRSDAELQTERAGAVEQIGAGQAQLQECRAVEREDEDERDAADDRVGCQEIKKSTLIDLVRTDGKPCDQIRDRNAPEECGDDAAEGKCVRPAALPYFILAMMAELEGDAAQDECGEHEEERNVEGAEHRRIDMRESRKRGTARRNHPDLVAVPDRADAADELRAVALLVGDECEERADAIVKTLEEEESREEDDDQHEPKNIVVHSYFPPSMAGVIFVRRMKRKAR